MKAGRFAFAAWLAATAAAVLAPGCTGDTCVEVEVDCEPLYEPTFENVYENTLSKSCAVGGSSCHTAEGARGGMAFVNVDQAHQMLRGEIDDKQRALPGDPECSLIVVRLAAEADEDVMPPGARLPDNEVCSIVQWIDRGARR